MTDAEIYDALTGLVASQLHELIALSGAPRRHLSMTAPLATVAAELLDWARQHPANRQSLADTLDRVRAPDRSARDPRPFAAPAASRPAAIGERSASRTPIVIAIEERGALLAEEQMLRAERHLTITLEPGQAEALERIHAELADAASIEACLTLGARAWRVLDDATRTGDPGTASRLAAVVASIEAALRDEPDHPQPVAWCGRSDLLTRICRAILAACSDSSPRAEPISVAAGAHYFCPIPPPGAPRSMQKRQTRTRGADIAIATLDLTADDADLVQRAADAIGAEVVMVDAARPAQALECVAELVQRSEHGATRLAIAHGRIELGTQFVDTLLGTLPAFSVIGPALDGRTVIDALARTLPESLPYQAVPAALSPLRREQVDRARDMGDVAAFRDALLWSTWSWVGRPLFARQFDEPTRACYPHLMDLRSVASRDWYFDRSEDIPARYRSEKLVDGRDAPEEAFHLYLSGAGGTGKSCFLRNVYDTLDINRPDVLPVWYKVDAPSSDWANVERRIKEETVRALERRLGPQAAALLDQRKDLRFALTDLVTKLRRGHAGIEQVVVFIDQLERTFESGDNPDAHRLETISKHFLRLLDTVGVAQGVRVFIASRKQYLPDFLDSFEKAVTYHLQFNVLQKISAPGEQVGFVSTVLDWCKAQHLVDPSVALDDRAYTELGAQVQGHPLNMMLTLIQVFSRADGGTITERHITEAAQDLFYIDERLAEKDDLDWYFFLAMAHARTEIVRFSEVWWRLRLVAPGLTARADSLGRQGVLERLWLLGHLGRTVHTRPLGADRAAFLEFFHANLRDHLITAVMNYGGRERPRGRRGGTPPVWRALDRLAAAARDWNVAPQLLLRDDVALLVEHKDVFVEPTEVAGRDGPSHVEGFYLLFMRDAEENREHLFQSAKECFVYSTIVHDVLGRWAFRQLFPDVAVQVALCAAWIRRSDRASRLKLLQYLIELRQQQAHAALAELVFAPAGTDVSDAWQQVAAILAEPLFAARYRSRFVIALLEHLQRGGIAVPGDAWHSERFGRFCAACCSHRRDELSSLLEKMVDDVASLQDVRLQGDVGRLLETRDLVDGWIPVDQRGVVDVAFRSREMHGHVPPRIELRAGAALPDTLLQADALHARLVQEFGVPLPPLIATVGDVPGSEAGEAAPDGRCEVALAVDGRFVAAGDFYPDRRQTLRRHWDLENMAVPADARLAYDDALHEGVVWLPRERLDAIGWRRTAVDAADALQRWTSVLLRRQITDVFTVEELMPFVEGVVAMADPRLNRREFLRMVSTHYYVLWRVVAHLVREGVPVAARRMELMLQLQELIRQTGQTNAPYLIQRLREHVRRELCAALSDGGTQLPVMLLDTELEQSLVRRLQVAEGRYALNLSPEQILKLAGAITGHFEAVLRTTDAAPVLLCEESLRLPLFGIVQYFNPRMHVLSYAELSPEIPPRSAGVVTGLTFPDR